MKTLKFLGTIAQWLLGVTFLICVFANGFHWTSIILVIAAVLMMPIKPIRNTLKKIKINSGIAVLLSIVLLFTGISCAPTSGSEDSDSSYIEEHEDNEKIADPDEEEAFSGLIGNDKTDTSSFATQNATESSTASKGVGAGKNAPIPSNQLPSYSGRPYIVLNKNTPNFSAAELTTKAYETYSPLDSLGRCGSAIASCGKEIMPAEGEERGSISSIKPSGWNQAKYSGISGGYLWNRCHLIGWQLSAENANRKNLITGTRYMNTEGMLPFENMIADYIEETGNHVAFRVTPIYEGNNLVCSGVQMEAYSIEDEGCGICFNVYCFNVQPNVTINYADGSSVGPTNPTTTTKKQTTTKQATTTKKQTTTEEYYDEPQSGSVWIPKTGSKYHSHSSCSNMKNPSKVTKSEAESMGYGPCKKCY